MTIASHRSVGRLFALACLGACVLAASGCQALSRAWEMHEELSSGYPSPPETLVADPATTGLLLIDGSVKHGWNRYGMDGALIRRLDTGEDLPAGVLTGDSGSWFGDIAFFSGLEAGGYRLVRMKAASMNGRMLFNVPAIPETSMSMTPGALIYLGKLRLIREVGFNKPMLASVEYDIEDEVRAWEMVNKRYPHSAWAPIIREHIGDLRRRGKPSRSEGGLAE